MLEILYVGYDSCHPEQFEYTIPGGIPCYQLILTQTPALFCVDGTRTAFPPYTAVLFPPGRDIWYAAHDGPYRDSWIRFTTDEPFVTEFLPLGIPFFVSDPEYCFRLIQLLTWEVANLSGTPLFGQGCCRITQSHGTASENPPEHGEESRYFIHQLMQILFGKLQNSLQPRPGTPYDYALLELRRRIAANPQLPWNVSQMAQELHISSGYLQYLYKQKFHCSCMNDIIAMRLEKAKELLAATSASNTQIAEQCGYRSTEFFCRQFRSHTGMTPGRFRRESSLQQS